VDAALARGLRPADQTEVVEPGVDDPATFRTCGHFTPGTGSRSTRSSSGWSRSSARTGGGCRSQSSYPPTYSCDPPVALEDERARDDVVEEGAVVADQQQRARELDQQLLEQLQRLDVEVVGRLVEHQHVGGRVNSRASSSRLRSPPDSAFTGDRARSGGNRKSCR
jgi:hypothetical protein